MQKYLTLFVETLLIGFDIILTDEWKYFERLITDVLSGKLRALRDHWTLNSPP